MDPLPSGNSINTHPIFKDFMQLTPTRRIINSNLATALFFKDDVAKVGVIVDVGSNKLE